jgi:hypothetical protein
MGVVDLNNEDIVKVIDEAKVFLQDVCMQLCSKTPHLQP